MIEELVVFGLIALAILVFILFIIWLSSKGYVKSGKPLNVFDPKGFCDKADAANDNAMIISSLNRGPDVNIEDILSKPTPSILKSMFWDW